MTVVSRETQCHCTQVESPDSPELSSSVSRETEEAGRLSPLAWLILQPLRAYRRFLSPHLAPRCRFYPSCSAYCEQAIEELGAVRGTILAAWRLLRCNPLTSGGFDELADRHLFRPAAPPPIRGGETA